MCLPIDGNLRRLFDPAAEYSRISETGLAPEITRFDAHGLVDDVGAMHNLLRPEAIEALWYMWRATGDW
ncbi:Endoplasmic reticulum mannosyl-oligosaccharide 1,2-alpha-mannosidase [Perkinsus olseni]|uniref:Endoplasmic reticulum mannosyl-oligosaccharide 1,2-alpha-mannosidase n=1 Tax=Perkinsus olseni TaxID=32597 RepID=A0A7J6SN18_PEROL|nr:Endoplasmic reticulum mannosyl-oligosaccharide 1,2-alpha-mannosidase [Perkinsus olseni]